MMELAHCSSEQDIFQSVIIFCFFFAECDGVFLSNGPGDPTFTTNTINNIRKFTERSNLKPLFGICFGHQLLGLAVGCKSFKMKLVEENLVPAFFLLLLISLYENHIFKIYNITGKNSSSSLIMLQFREITLEFFGKKRENSSYT